MSHQSIVNDPNFVPLATASGIPLCTEDGETIIIVSSTLRVRLSSTRFGKTKSWLKTPKRLTRGR